MVKIGAEQFEHYVNNPDPDEAFRTAQDEAFYDHGHSGYSGTIAEKPSYQIITDDVFTASEANTYMDTVQDHPIVDDKWGPAAAIRVADDKRDGWLFFGWASS